MVNGVHVPLLSPSFSDEQSSSIVLAPGESRTVAVPIVPSRISDSVPVREDRTINGRKGKSDAEQK